MYTLVARLLQPAPAALAVLVAALVVIVTGVALAVALAAAADPISAVPTDTSPFRWT